MTLANLERVNRDLLLIDPEEFEYEKNIIKDEIKDKIKDELLFIDQKAKSKSVKIEPGLQRLMTRKMDQDQDPGKRLSV